MTAAKLASRWWAALLPLLLLAGACNRAPEPPSGQGKPPGSRPAVAQPQSEFTYMFRGPVFWEVRATSTGRRERTSARATESNPPALTLRHRMTLREEAQPDPQGGWRVSLRCLSLEVVRSEAGETERTVFTKGSAHQWINGVEVDREDAVLGKPLDSLEQRLLFAAPMEFSLRYDGELADLADIPESTINSIPSMSLVDLLTRLHPRLPQGEVMVGKRWEEQRPAVFDVDKLQSFPVSWVLARREGDQAGFTGEGQFTLRRTYGGAARNPSFLMAAQGTFTANVTFDVGARQISRGEYLTKSNMNSPMLPVHVVRFNEQFTVTRSASEPPPIAVP